MAKWSTNDSVSVVRSSGANKQEFITINELNELISAEESADIKALQNIVQTAKPGKPVSPVASSLSLEIATGVTLDLTAKTAGIAGDDISITLVDPGEDADLSISVAGTDITVNLESVGSAINSSLAEIKAAIEANPEAAALVSVGVTGSDATIAIAVAKTNLIGGIDGTIGFAGAIRCDGDGLYVSPEESTTAVSFWKTITFDS